MKKILPGCLVSLLGIVVSVALIVGIILSVRGCDYVYPEELTGEYLYQNYVEMDYNYMYTRIYPNASDDGNAYNVSGTVHRFFALHDESIENYVVCKRGSWIFDTHDYVVYASKDSETDLVGEYGVDRISLVLWKGTGGEKTNAISYEKKTVAKELATTQSEDICNSLRVSISNEDAFLKQAEPDISDIGLGEILYCMEEEYLNSQLFIRVYTPRSKSIFWESRVVFYEGKYCLAHYHDDSKSYYDVIPLSDEASDYIKSVISESGYSFDYEYKNP